MTRNSEEIQYPDAADTISAKKKYDQQQRAAMIAQYPNGILISIHLSGHLTQCYLKSDAGTSGAFYLCIKPYFANRALLYTKLLSRCELQLNGL